MKLAISPTPLSKTPFKILVVGATGGTGLAVVQQLLQEGHQVTAFSRHASGKLENTSQLKTIDGDVMVQADIELAVQGQDVVIVVLGISENPFRVRLFGTANTPRDVRSMGTRNVIDAMRKQGITRLVVQSTYGVGATRGLLGFADQLFFSLLLKPQIEDTEVQEQVVRDSGVEWVLAQPVHLVDSEDSKHPYLSTSGKTRVMKVSRAAVARFLTVAALEPDFVGKTVTVSG